MPSGRSKVHHDLTLDDVARLAGVSRATASRVLSGAGDTSRASQVAVRDAAARLGYQVNPAARALASRAATLRLEAPTAGRLVLGVVGPTREATRDPYVATALTAIAEVALDFGASVSLEWLALGGTQVLRRLAEQTDVRGVILINTVERLLAEVPRALVGRVVSIGVGSNEVPRFEIDTAGAAEAMVGHLIRTGRREIAMVTGPAWLPCVRPQIHRYIDVMSAAGLQPRTIGGDFTSAAGAAGVVQALHRWPTTDAIFAACDAAALGALSELRRRGLRVPDDVAVAGFDDIPFAAQAAPSLTTSTHPVARIAATAALSLLEPSAADQLTRLFDSELVLRETA